MRSSGKQQNLIPAHEGIKKTETEVKHIWLCRKDGVALLKLYRWLEAELQYRTVKQYELAQQLAAFPPKLRAITSEKVSPPLLDMLPMAPLYYKPGRIPALTSGRRAILLLDSGGQYIRHYGYYPHHCPRATTEGKGGTRSF